MTELRSRPGGVDASVSYSPSSVFPSRKDRARIHIRTRSSCVWTFACCVLSSWQPKRPSDCNRAAGCLSLPCSSPASL